MSKPTSTRANRKEVLTKCLAAGKEILNFNAQLGSDAVTKYSSKQLVKFDAVTNYKIRASDDVKYTRVSKSQTFDDLVKTYEQPSTIKDKTPPLRTKNCFFIGDAEKSLVTKGEKFIISFCLPTGVGSPCFQTVCFDTEELYEHVQLRRQTGKPVTNPAYTKLVETYGEEYVNKTLNVDPILSTEVQETIEFHFQILKEYNTNVTSLLTEQEKGLLVTLLLPAIKSYIARFPMSGLFTGIYRVSPNWLKYIWNAPERMTEFVLTNPGINQVLLVISKVLRVLACIWLSPTGGLQNAKILLEALDKKYEGGGMTSWVIKLSLRLLSCTGGGIASCVVALGDMLGTLTAIPRMAFGLVGHVLGFAGSLFLGNVSPTVNAFFSNPWKFLSAKITGNSSATVDVALGVLAEQVGEDFTNNMVLFIDIACFTIIALILEYVPVSLIDALLNVVLPMIPGALQFYTEFRQKHKDASSLDLLLKGMREMHKVGTGITSLWLTVIEIYRWVKDILYSVVVCNLVGGTKCGCLSNILEQLGVIRRELTRKDADDKSKLYVKELDKKAAQDTQDTNDSLRRRKQEDEARGRLQRTQEVNEQKKANYNEEANVQAGKGVVDKQNRTWGQWVADVLKPDLPKRSYYPSKRRFHTTRVLKGVDNVAGIPINLYKVNTPLHQNKVHKYYYGVSTRDLGKRFPKAVTKVRGKVKVNYKNIPAPVHQKLNRVNKLHH